MFEKTKINKKEAGVGPFKKKIINIFPTNFSDQYQVSGIGIQTDNLFNDESPVITSRPGADPIKNISRVNLRYACIERCDWLFDFSQPIGVLKTGVA